MVCLKPALLGQKVVGGAGGGEDQALETHLAAAAHTADGRG